MSFLAAVAEFLGKLLKHLLPTLLREARKPQDVVFVDADKDLEKDMAKSIEESIRRDQETRDGKHSTTRRILPLLALALALSVGGGCSWLGLTGFNPPEVVRHPDAPLLVLEVNGSWAQCAAYDAREHKLVPVGWVDLRDLSGWTITKYNWNEFISKQKAAE